MVRIPVSVYFCVTFFRPPCFFLLPSRCASVAHKGVSVFFLATTVLLEEKNFGAANEILFFQYFFGRDVPLFCAGPVVQRDPASSPIHC